MSTPPAEPQLDAVRAELRRLGYLSNRVDRLLLQDALRPRAWSTATLRLAARVGLLAGLPAAAAATLALAMRNDLLARDPLSMLPLLVHVAVPVCLAAASVFALLAVLELAVLARAGTPRLDRLSGTLTGIGAVAAALVAVVSARGGDTLLSTAQLGGVALVAALAGYSALSLVRGGLLALGIARTGRAPVSRRARSWVVGAGAVVAAILTVAPALLAARRPLPAGAEQLPGRAGASIVLVGIDGVLASELDYLLGRGDLPVLGGPEYAVFGYQRPPGPPASLWTSVASGVEPELHGVRAVDGFRPLGVGEPLVAPAPLRWWWERVGRPLGLVEHRPALSGRRAAAFLWELVARGGDPVLAINWWSTFPAEPIAGAVIAHGAWALLGVGASEGTVAPASLRGAVVDGRAAAEREAERWVAGLGDRDAAQRAVELALAPDLGAVALARRLSAELRPRATALYLAAPDLLAAEGLEADSSFAFADLLRSELQLLDGLIGELARPGVAVAVVVDPGRRGSHAGRVLLRSVSGGCPRHGGEIALGAVAAALARDAGLPASEELPPPPAACSWPPPPATVASWGRRATDAVAPGDAAEYLESLRSLGYL